MLTPDSVTIGAPILSAYHVAVAQRLRIALCTSGERCMLIASSSDVGSPSWRHRTIGHIRDSAVYVPLVSAAWFDDEICQLELYYALRNWVTAGQPIVIPILFPDIPAATTNKLLAIMKAVCFHIPYEGKVEDVAVRVHNLCVDMLVGRSATTDAASLKEAYCATLTTLGGKKPNTGMLKYLADNEVAPGPSAAILSDNYIGDLGVRAFFATVVPRWPLLRTVAVCGNGLNNESVRHLCDALLYHPSLTSLDISRNVEITQAGGAEIVLLCRRNQVLREFNVEGTSIPPVWKRKIEAQLALNRTSAVHETLFDGGGGVFGAECPVVPEEVVHWGIHFSGETISGTLGTPSATTPFSVKDDGTMAAYAATWLASLDVNTIVLHGLNGKKMMFALETEACAFAPFLQRATRQVLASMPQHNSAVNGKAARYTLKLVLATLTGGVGVLVEVAISYSAKGQMTRRGLARVLREGSVYRANGNLTEELCELLAKAYEREMREGPDNSDDDKDSVLGDDIEAAEAEEGEHTEGTRRLVSMAILNQWQAAGGKH